jgi:hypothetical protein
MADGGVGMAKAEEAGASGPRENGAHGEGRRETVTRGKGEPDSPGSVVEG